nr:unnamed protein product [Callosobruchus chinensis]
MHPGNFFSLQGVVLHTSSTVWFDRTFVHRLSRVWNRLPGAVLVEPASVDLFKSRVKKLPLT